MPFYVAARAPSTAGEDAQADRYRSSGGSERPGPAVRVRRPGTWGRLEIERDPSGVVIGAVAVRTREIYLLMITLAIAVSFYFFVQANVEFLNGYEGIRNVMGPDILGVPLRTPAIFFYAVLAVSAALYALVIYVSRAPLGLVLQGIRDNPRRVSALGFNVALHRIAAFGLAGFIAGVGGVLLTFYNIGISPGTVSTQPRSAS